MKWHDHPLFYKSMIKREGNDYSVEELINDLNNAPNTTKGERLNSIAQLRSEVRWVEEDRPYYNLYPSVVEAFTKIDLGKVTCDQVKLPISPLMIRTQEGHTLGKVQTLLVHEPAIHEIEGATRAWIVSINDGYMLHGIAAHSVNGLMLTPGTTIADKLTLGRQNSYSESYKTIDQGMIEDVFRLIVALCLLKDNPDLISPEPLEADRAKWEATHDPKLLEKAARRGKRAWSVGKHIEVAPGFRRPHFAIRWCGKGRADPQLRPIKGCLVCRKAIEEVPTDWLGPDPELVGVCDEPVQSW